MSSDKNAGQHSGYAEPGRKGFLPGNPGRKLGVKNRFSRETMEAVKKLSISALAMLQTKIAQGDMRAVEFVLSRCVPAGRTIELDGMTAEDVVEMASEGVLTTSELKDLAATLAKLREVTDLDELHKRIAQLERMVRQ